MRCTRSRTCACFFLLADLSFRLGDRGRYVTKTPADGSSKPGKPAARFSHHFFWRQFYLITCIFGPRVEVRRFPNRFSWVSNERLRTLPLYFLQTLQVLFSFLQGWRDRVASDVGDFLNLWLGPDKYYRINALR